MQEARGKGTYGYHPAAAHAVDNVAPELGPISVPVDPVQANTQISARAVFTNFQGSSYQWLVVAGPKVQFKGDGAINGAGSYGFILTALDAELTPSAKADRFRIKIWDQDNGGAVVYDNQMGDADDAEASTQIGGGSIVIHTKK